MGNQPSPEQLTDSLNQTLSLLEQLLVQHREAEAYEVARGRVLFLQEQFRLLYTELATLKAMCVALAGTGADPAALHYWRDMCEALYRQEPACLVSPGRAILAGDLELLNLVLYTGAAVALVRERAARLGADLRASLQNRPESNSIPAVTGLYTAELPEQQLSAAFRHLIARNVLQEADLLSRLMTPSPANQPTHESDDNNYARRGD
jgi:hypothetical protein